MRKTSERDFKNMQLTWGTAEREAKDGEKGLATLSSMDRGKQRRVSKAFR